MSATTLQDTAPASLPVVLAGPILRRLEARRVVIWLACSVLPRVRLRLTLDAHTNLCFERQPGEAGCRSLSAGQHLHYLLLDLRLDQPLPEGRWIAYELSVATQETGNPRWQDWRDWAPALCYPGRDTPGFVFAPRVAALLHGSCRKPHHHGGDGLVRADDLLRELLAAGVADGAPPPHPLPAWPSALVMSGDQIYADDVAGPMLRAIHRLLPRLGLADEMLPGAEDTGLRLGSALINHPDGYYRRERLLPRHQHNLALIEVLFGGVEKPVFTSDNAHNHLITLGEVLAMYLLAWSPAVWAGLTLDPPPGLSAEEIVRYGQELEHIERFRDELPAVRRLLAHLPCAMIFDDHDVTDDWNLSREWEQVAYGHPFSSRVIGNALFAYLINQAWGNHPDAFPPSLLALLQDALHAPGQAAHEEALRALQGFDQWHYQWPTQPPLVVIDTRTHRWRSESAARRPSGLMDWEALTDLQHSLRDHSAVLLVSPAPIFGVKLIETVQRLFTWSGHPLMVDAENWMAHRGAAHAILNIFRHPRTPQHFVVLSGDVHYSFVYDVELRGDQRGPDIWQICSSGLRNEFPPRLLDLLDRANRWLYAPRSPLNWFTRRRHMRVIPRKPEGTAHGRRLLNGSGIGVLELDMAGTPWRIRQLLADGRNVAFTRREAESRWD